MGMIQRHRGLVRLALRRSNSRLDILGSTAELAGCSTRELRSLLQYVDEVTVPAGTQIAVRGETCNQFVVVAAGRLRAGSPEDGWNSLFPGDTVGWAAMWEMTANNATVIAETDSRLLVMGHAQFRAVKAIVKRPAAVLAAHRIFRAPISAANAHESMTVIAPGAR
jgi:CRP-like cAMP-binding protein